MSITAIIPIIILSACIILSGFIFRAFKRMPTLNMRGSKGFIFLYVLLLIGSVIIFVLLPSKGETVLSEKEVEALYEENMELENAFQEGKVENLDHMLVDTLSYDVVGEKLILTSSLGIRAKVWVEWIDSETSVVEGNVYRANYVFNGIKAGPSHLQINWDGEVLSLSNELEAKREIHYLKADLSSDEFISDYHQYYFWDTIYIHLKVPKHLDVIDESGLQFS